MARNTYEDRRRPCDSCGKTNHATSECWKGENSRNRPRGGGSYRGSRGRGSYRQDNYHDERRRYDDDRRDVYGPRNERRGREREYNNAARDNGPRPNRTTSVGDSNSNSSKSSSSSSSSSSGPRENAIRLTHPERAEYIACLPAPDGDKGGPKEGKAIQAARVHNKVCQLNLRHGAGASQVAVHCNIGGKDVLAVVDTGAEVSLIRRSIVSALKIKTREADFDLISLSNIAMETYGILDSRVKFEEGSEVVNAQACISVVPDAIFEQAVGALLGMDVLNSLNAKIDLKEKTLIKQLVEIRGIRSRDDAMAAAVT